MRKALIVGIDYYEFLGNLSGSVNDAHAVKEKLDRNDDGSINSAQPKMMVGSEAHNPVKRIDLKEAVRALFADDGEVALFYFSGHGYLGSTDGYLCASDCSNGDDGLSLAELMTLANKSPALNKVIILDSCHSGAIGEHAIHAETTEITEGVTILTASTRAQAAIEQNGGGVFTNLLIDALGGAAANLVGQVTPGSMYAHIDQSLGSWEQRPIFKTNIKRFVVLRDVKPPIPQEDLRRIVEFFPNFGFEFQLDPSYEPRDARAIKKHTEIFAILQKYNRVNLLVPIGVLHMYDAAMESRSVQLTRTGEHYRRLVERGLI